MLIKGKAPFADGCATVISTEAAKSKELYLGVADSGKTRVPGKTKSHELIKAKARRLLKNCDSL